MKRSATAIRSQLLLFGAIVTVAAVALVAATRPHAKATSAPLATQQPARTAGAADAGMRAYIDPETGQLGVPPAPTAEESAILLPEGTPRKIVNADGSITVELNGACQEYSIMRLDAHGNRTVVCTDDPTKALQTPAPAAKPEER